MNFSSDIDLTHRSTIAVVSSLWNKEDVITDIKGLLEINTFSRGWTDIEKKVMSHLEEVILPVELKLNLENLVEPMGMQLYKWISLTLSIFTSFRRLPQTLRFFWTERGTLDSVKTATFITDHCQDKELRFCLACVFCIEKTIQGLWPEVGPTIGEKVKVNPSAIESILVLYWVYFLSSDVETLMILTEYCGIRNMHEFAFLFVSEVNCTSTLKYFLEHVEPQRKKKAVYMALQDIFRASRPRKGDVLLFLFSYLEESEVNETISKNARNVLSSLLEWPCQEFFMPVAHSNWSHISSLDYLNLFDDIAECVSRHSGVIYKNIAKEFWQSSPPSHKEYLISKCKSGTFLSRLFLRENSSEMIQMVFRDCSPEERLRMIFYFEGMNVCDLLVKREKWDLLRMFVTSCIPTRHVLEEFLSCYETERLGFRTKEVKWRTVVLKEKIRDWYSEL